MKQNPLVRQINRRYHVQRRTFSVRFGQPLDATSSYSDTDFSYYETREVGANIPGWKQAIRRGDSATTSLNGQRMNVEFTPGHLVYNNAHVYPPGDTVRFPGDYLYGGSEMSGLIATPQSGPGYPTLAFADYSKALNQALARANNRISQAQTSFQGGVFLGELRETVHMLTRPSKALFLGLWDYLTVAKELRRKSPRKHRRRIISDTWLEFSFGWKPLVSDINDAIDTLADLTEDPGIGMVPFRGTGKDEYAEDIGSKNVTVGGTSATWRIMRKETVDVKIYGAMREETLARVGTMTRLGLGFNNFVPTVYELIPYSFLVDYFSNLGDIVNALATNTSAVSWVNIGTKVTISEWTYDPHVETIPSDDSNSNSGGGSPGSFKWEAVTVSRAPYLGSLVPGLEFEIPVGGSLKWLNMAALLSRHQSLLPF